MSMIEKSKKKRAREEKRRGMPSLKKFKTKENLNN